jgi:GTP:adenosylcobinamide-phosphate guanylyltransferase
MDAVVIAGGVPQPGEPLYPYTQGKPKALLDICGKPMAQWVLDALSESQKIDRVVVTGLEADCGLKCEKIQAYLPSAGSILGNIRSGAEKILELNPTARYVAVVSSDIPSIKAEHVDWVVDAAMQTQEDVYYNVIQQETMEARFPGSNRTYTHLKGIVVCGGDLNVLGVEIVRGDASLGEKIISARKNPLKQAALVGFDTLFLLLIRQITIDAAAARVTKRLGITGRALVCPYAEIGMDVDKPHQLEIMRADLARRAG